MYTANHNYTVVICKPAHLLVWTTLDPGNSNCRAAQGEFGNAPGNPVSNSVIIELEQIRGNLKPSSYLTQDEGKRGFDVIRLRETTHSSGDVFSL